MEEEAVPQGAGGDASPGETLALYLSRLFLPLSPAEVLTANPSAENRQWLKACFGDPVLRVVSRDALLALLQARFGAALLDQAVFGLARRSPELSAQTVMTRAQAMAFGAVAVLLLAGFVLFPLTVWRALVALLSAAVLASAVFRTWLAYCGTAPRPAATPGAVALPRYTILVPLYREAAILPDLIAALCALDYPPDLLDVKLVLEADDRETIEAAMRLAPGNFEIVAVPDGGPRTKPKAANYALAFARGEYLVVYDAEDRPEPDQLKRAVATFRAAPRTTACLQARLNFYNAHHNWLTSGIMAQTPLELNRAAA